MYTFDDEQVQRNKVEYAVARMMRRDAWVIACGGTEQPFLHTDGEWYVYVHNFKTGQHGFLCLSTDIVNDNLPAIR